MDDKCNVFISWSGENSVSQNIATIFRDWLPHVIQHVKPFVSSEDIQIGTRWQSMIEKSLRDNYFGIICVTKDNYKAPWLLFEAGALSNNISRTPIVPFLFGLEPSDLMSNPLTQFQSTVYYGNKDNKESIKKLVQSLNDTFSDNRLSDSILNKSFEKWYPDLEKSFSSIEIKTDVAEEKPEVEIDKNRTILEELLKIARNTQKAVSNNDTISLEHIFDQNKYIRPYNVLFELGDVDGASKKSKIEITQDMSISDVLDIIYYALNKRVKAFTYLVDWILREKKTSRKLVVASVQRFIPAYNIFKENSIWEVQYLEEPYIPNIEENRRWYSL